jgi:hypothetical protein
VGLPDGDGLWLFWPAGQVEIARRVLALAGAEIFLQEKGILHRPGECLPVFHVPEATAARPLSALLFPSPVTARPAGPSTWEPFRLSLVHDGTPRAATALRLTVAELARWAEGATSHQFQGLQAARTSGCSGGGEVLLLGNRLPAISGERFWGRQVLLPLGYRVEPNLAEGVLVGALRLQVGEVALWTAGGIEFLPATAFGPITRAGARLAPAEQPRRAQRAQGCGANDNAEGTPA